MTRNDRHLRLGEALPATVAGLARAWGGAWGAILIGAAVWSARPWMQGVLGWAWLAATAIATLVLAGALARISISDDLTAARRLGLGLGPAGLQFDRTELRLLGAALLCAVFLAMIVSVAALVLLAVYGVAELNVEAIKARDWGAVGAPWKLALLGVITLVALYAVVVLAVRLSLFAPATAGRGHMVSLNSMGVAQGNFWPLLGGVVVTAAPKLALVLLTGLGLLSGTAGWVVWAIVLNAVQAPATLAFLGAAYRRLEYWTPTGETR